MQIIVDLPGFVADPQVVGRLAHRVQEDHKVGQQDLIHLAPGHEAVQFVLTGRLFPVRRLAGQVATHGMDALPRRFEHRRDGVLGEPIDLQRRRQPAQLTRDGQVALHMAQADRAGDE